jgi:acetyltransferase-like isoleucine patch superfamily enzyme
MSGSGTQESGSVAGSSPERSLRAPGRASAPVSVLILTLNEEINIRACIESCAWSDDVIVLDSGSEDRTVQIAESMGARVFHNPFESFGKQRNWAIDNIQAAHEWIFHLDADERFTPELVEELRSVLGRKPKDAGYFVPSKLMLQGKWLRRSGGYPTYQMRFFHKQRMRFRDYGHGQREDTSGEVGTLESPYLHYAFSKGIYDWIDKHNRYSTLEALQILRAAPRRHGVGELLQKDRVKRRRAWKELSYRVPLWRPAARWFITLFIQGGILEGRQGRTYAKMLALYEQMTSLKLRLLRSPAANDEPPQFERDTKPGKPSRSVQPVDSMLGEGQHGPVVDGAWSTRIDSASAPASAAAQGAFDSTQLAPESSPWTFREKVIRAIWMLVGRPLFRLSFHNWYAMRSTLLRLFGAKIGKNVHIRPSVNIEIPWNLDIRDGVTVGDYAILYSLGRITIGERTIVSQYAHLCAGTHDYTDRRFPLIRDPIWVGPDAWIGADAFVGPNVTVGALSVLGARASAYKDIAPGKVYVGNPARPIKDRELH